jgi:two-component system chemotaxis response regulator CheY
MAEGKGTMGKKVIVVDDSRTVRQQVSTVLTQAGYEVIEASDGVEGAETIDATQDVAMVICDVNMPRMNGIDMLSLLKKNPKHANLVVLMLTTEGQPGPIAKAKQAGAKGWIVKPFETDMLLAAVRKLAGAPA